VSRQVFDRFYWLILLLGMVALCAVLWQISSVVGPLFSLGCKNRIVDSARSPDGRLIAIIYTRDCGPRSRPSSHIALLGGNESLRDEPGNLFQSNEQRLQLEWLSAKRLLIRIQSAAGISVRRSTWGDLRIEYAATIVKDPQRSATIDKEQ
jgi:hypothetical protein